MSSPEAQAAGLSVQLEVLEGSQQVEHRAVVDEQRSGGGVLPGCPWLAAFEERELVGVEQVPGVGKQLHPLVLDPAVDRPEGGEEPDPGIVPPLQDLLALLVGRLLEPGHEGRDGVVLVVERVAQQEQVPLLGREQEHEPHHDREGGPVEFGLGHARQELPLFVLVDPVDARMISSTASRT